MRSTTQRSFLLAFGASIAACGLVGVYCLLQGQIGTLEEAILASTAVFCAAAILGLAGAVSFECRRWHPVGLLGMLLSVGALGFVLVGIWCEYFGTRIWRIDLFWKTTTCLWVGAVGFSHVGLLALARLHARYGWIRRWTVVAIALLAANIVFIVVAQPPNMGEAFVRILGILAIASACGTLAVPIFHRISAIRSKAEVKTTQLSVSLVCPRCSKGQLLPTGSSKCASCGLRISIAIEEELCNSCGYSLYQLNSAHCPECGTAVVGVQNPPTA